MEYLPQFCYSQKVRKPDSLCLHWVSCIYADPDNWDDPERIWQMLHDLNLPREHQKYGPWAVDLGNGHQDGIYASYDWLFTADGHRIDLVPYGHKTWHAGKSYYRGRFNCNEFMAGAGIIAAPAKGREYDFTELQYSGIAEIILEKNFGTRVTDHKTIRKGYKQRFPENKVKDKHDVGKYWDWGRLNRYLRDEIKDID